LERANWFYSLAYNLTPVLTVEENVEVGSEISNEPLEINNILKQVSMIDKRKKSAYQLSRWEGNGSPLQGRW
jgi:putative ABC transport system ATP-binding protein